MSNGWYALIISIVFVLVFALVFFKCTPTGVSVINTWFGAVRKADDMTDYDTLKKVEDTCRSMIASYNSDKMTYEQYKNYESDEQRSWADQAKMRANKTASTYNNYILKNSHVWKEDVPADIYISLPYIE